MQVEGTWRAHQVPLAGLAENPEHLRLLEEWMRSYRPEELFDANGAPVAATARAAADRRSAHGHEPARQWRPAAARSEMPDFRDYAVAVPTPGGVMAEATRALGRYCATSCARTRAISASSVRTRRHRTGSTAVFEATDRTWEAEILPDDDHLSRDGRVMEVLSEQLCEGWLEGYLLTGRHGFFSCYEAFIHIVDSMFNQHAKWLKACTRHSVAAPDRVAELSADQPCLAPGP